MKSKAPENAKISDNLKKCKKCKQCKKCKDCEESKNAKNANFSKENAKRQTL